MVDQSCSDLNVKEPGWPLTNGMQDKAHFLAAGMNHRCPSGVGQQPPEGFEFRHLEGVDHRQFTSRSHLDQTELAAVGVLRDKLSVKS